MMRTTFSWSTWTWKSFCQRMASPQTLLRITKISHSSPGSPLSSRFPQHPPYPLWSTSAATPLPPFIQPWSPRTVSRAPQPEQVKDHITHNTQHRNTLKRGLTSARSTKRTRAHTQPTYSSQIRANLYGQSLSCCAL
jgi:hypothetical protein